MAGPWPVIGKNRSTELGRMGVTPYFTPGYVKSSSSGSIRGPVQKNSMAKTVGMDPSGISGGRKVISSSIQQDFQLSKADNSWKPTLVTKEILSSDHSAATKVCCA